MCLTPVSKQTIHATRFPIFVAQSQSMPTLSAFYKVHRLPIMRRVRDPMDRILSTRLNTCPVLFSHLSCRCGRQHAFIAECAVPFERRVEKDQRSCERLFERSLRLDAKQSRPFQNLIELCSSSLSSQSFVAIIPDHFAPTYPSAGSSQKPRCEYAP